MPTLRNIPFLPHSVWIILRDLKNLKGKLCRECNRQIGSIEEQFLRCGPEAFFRYILGIKGRKSNVKINPYRRPSAGGKPIKAEIPAPDGPERFLCEQINDSNDFSYFNQIVLKDPAGNFHPVIVSDDVTSSESLDKLLVDKGMSELEFQSANIDHEKKYIIEGLSIVRGKSIAWNDLPVGHHGKKKVSYICRIY